MEKLKIDLNQNVLKLTGYITFNNIVISLDTCIKKTEKFKNIKIDLKNIYTLNSSVLIFIINYIKISNKKEQKIQFINIPILLLELSKIYNLNTIIQKN